MRHLNILCTPGTCISNPVTLQKAEIFDEHFRVMDLWTHNSASDEKQFENPDKPHGMRSCAGKNVPMSLNLQIALANALVMAVAMAGGEVVSDFLPDWVVTVLPGMVFIALGLVASSELILDLRPSPQPAGETA